MATLSDDGMMLGLHELMKALEGEKHYYVLDGRTPVRDDDQARVLEWCKNNNIVVACDVIVIDPDKEESIVISTTFQPVWFVEDGPPLTFRTIVYNDKKDPSPVDCSRRCATWEEAERQHADLVEKVKLALADVAGSVS